MDSIESSEHSLDVHSWLVVCTFMIVIILVIRPVRIPLPIPCSRRKHSNYISTNTSTPLPTTIQASAAEGSATTIAAATSTGPSDERPRNINNDSENNVLSKKQKRRTKYPYHITLNIATAPVLGVLFLLATQSIDGESVRNGIVGEPESGVEPYAVMILFFSLAYICISLDMTGVLQYAAFVISKRGGGGGQRIFLYFFLLSTIMSGLTSNDVVILTMTPFLVYFSRAVDLVTPVAFLMAEVQTANIASMALYIGNLTNVVACQAYGVSFLEYSAWMLLPTFASIAACYVMLRINFRKEKYIPKTIKSPDVDPRSCLVDPFGAIFGLAVLSSSLICLIGTSFAHVSVWIVTGPFALLTLTRDIWHDYRGNFKGVPEPKSDAAPGDVQEGAGATELNRKESYAAADGGVEGRIEQGLPGIAVREQSYVHPVQILGAEDNNGDDDSDSDDDDEEDQHNQDIAQLDQPPKGPMMASSNEKQDSTGSVSKDRPEEISIPVSSDDAPAQQSILSPRPTTTTGARTPKHPRRRTIKHAINRFEHRWPLLYAIIIRMPWAILPFTFSMFIMVEGLSNSGWIAIFAGWATNLIPNYIVATYAVGFISVLLCNLFNNVPMTILVARILQHPRFVGSPLATPEVVRGCLFGLIVGSNLGACTTLISSLAGLMWDSVLRSKKSNVGFWGFFRWNMGVMPMVIFIALSVVVIELKVIYK